VETLTELDIDGPSIGCSLSDLVSEIHRNTRYPYTPEQVLAVQHRAVYLEDDGSITLFNLKIRQVDEKVAMDKFMVAIVRSGHLSASEYYKQFKKVFSYLPVTEDEFKFNLKKFIKYYNSWDSNDNLIGDGNSYTWPYWIRGHVIKRLSY
jgi:hypothetical protein